MRNPTTSTARRRPIALAIALSLTAATAPAAAAISDGIVKIGVLTDMNGPFVDNVGPGSVLATRLAVEEFGGKVAGKPIEVVVADHQNKADIGSARAREWLDRDQVDVITELGNSAVALASIKIAQDKGRMTMVTGAGATRISNEDCAPTNVHWVYDTYSLAKVGTQPTVARGSKTWYFIAADYSFGHALQQDGTTFINAAGGKVLGGTRYPFPGTDFASALLSAQGSGASAVAFATAGNDLQNAIKQAAEFGLPKKQQMVAMLMSIVDVHSMTLQAAQGMYFAETFYWDLDEESRKFGRRFFEKFKRMPTALQAGQYSAVLNYLRAVQASGSDDVKDVVRTLKSMKIHDAFARNAKLRDDGKLTHDMYLVQVKAPADSKYPWDYYKVVQKVPGDQAFTPLAESKCPLVK
jgi:branched-chain amino acid transport system substrate-binding protein